MQHFKNQIKKRDRKVLELLDIKPLFKNYQNIRQLRNLRKQIQFCMKVVNY